MNNGDDKKVTPHLGRIAERVSSQRGEWCVFVLLGLGLLAAVQTYPTVTLIGLLGAGALMFDGHNNYGLWSLMWLGIAVLEPLIPLLQGLMGLTLYTIIYSMVALGRRVVPYRSAMIVSWCEHYIDDEHYRGHLSHFTRARQQFLAAIGRAQPEPTRPVVVSFATLPVP